MKQIEVEGGRSRAEGKRVKGGGQRRHMSTLIEKTQGSIRIRILSWFAPAAAVHLQDNAPIAEIARLNYNVVNPWILRSPSSSFAFTVDLMQTIAVGIKSQEDEDEEEESRRSQILRIKLKLI